MEIRVKAAAFSVLSNTFLVTAKLAVGIIIGSVSVISEAIHSANDLLASFIALFAVKTASKPPDEGHNYGHGKVENISGTIEAIMIFIAAIMIIKEAVDRLMGGGTMMDPNWGIVVMGVSAALNLGVSTYLHQVARREDSIALEADAMHLRTDVYTSAGVCVGLILIKITGWNWIDPVVAILVALIIIKAAYDLTRRAFTPLLDTALNDEELEQITLALAEFRESYIGYHDIRTRKSGRESYIDLHLVVGPDMSVKDVHDLCDRIEEKICDKIPYAQVLIHVEPADYTGSRSDAD